MQQFDTPPPAPPEEVGWQRLHISSPLLNAIATAIRVWPLFLIAIVNGGSGLVTFSLLAAAGLALLAVSVVRYLRFDYRLEGTSLVVRGGVFVRRTRTIPADRVQQVTRNEKLRHRLLGVAEASVEVAGAGAEPDVTLSVVSTDEAERIRVRLQDARRAVGAPPPPPDRVAFEQPSESLARWAAVSSPLFLLPAIGAAFGVFGETVDIEQAWTWLPDGSQWWFVVILAVLGLGAATAVNVIRFYDMRLIQADDNLRLEYGLLTHRKLEVPTERVQALTTRLSPAGRMSGTLGLTAHNASGAGEATNAYLPAVPRAERPRLLELLIPGVAVDAPITGHPQAALRRSILRWIRPALAAAIVAWLVLQTAWAAATMLIVVPAALAGWRAFRVLGHGQTTDVIISRRGVVTDQIAAVRKSRVQSAAVKANWFQRRVGLATLQIDVAQPLGRVVIRDMDATEATELAETTISGIYRAGLQGGEGETGKHDEQNSSLDP